MESNIDPIEWRREIDRVEKLLEIEEYPEFFISGSQSENSVPAINNNLINERSTVERLKNQGQFLEKFTNKKYIGLLVKTWTIVDNDLNMIDTFESRISQSDYLCERVKDLLILVETLAVQQIRNKIQRI